MKKKPFTPKTIEKARIAAGFKCCVCRIKPCFCTHHHDQKKDNDFDTAAPLCNQCHDLYGPDLQKQKFIRQARDDLYKRNEETRSLRKKEIELNRVILEKLEALEAKTATKDEILNYLIPKVVSTLSSIEGDVMKYAKDEDYNSLAQSLSSLGSSATYSSGQIHSIKAIGEDEEKKTNNRFTIDLFLPASNIWPIKCQHCEAMIYDQRILPGSTCPYCKNILK